jgi:hypothetical protein
MSMAFYAFVSDRKSRRPGNDQAPMTNKSPMTNDQYVANDEGLLLGFGHRAFVGH